MHSGQYPVVLVKSRVLRAICSCSGSPSATVINNKIACASPLELAVAMQLAVVCHFPARRVGAVVAQQFQPVGSPAALPLAVVARVALCAYPRGHLKQYSCRIKFNAGERAERQREWCGAVNNGKGSSMVFM